MSVRSSQSVTVDFVTSRFDTGAATNADSTPAGTLVVNGTDNGASVTVTNVSTGIYKAAVTLPTLAVGDVAQLRIAATVNSVAGVGMIWTDTKDVVIDSSGLVDANAVKVGPTGSGTAQTARDLGTSVLVGDKTGFSLSTGGIQAIWDALTSALTTVSSVGKLLVDNINATISSRMATFTLPTNFSSLVIDSSGRIDLGKWLSATPNGLSQGFVQSIPLISHGNTLAANTTSNTATLDGTASSTNDFYKGQMIVILSGAAGGQSRLCTGYNGVTKVATVAPNWSPNSLAGTSYAVYGWSASDVQMWKGSVPNVLISGRVDSDAEVVGDKSGYALTSDYDPAKTASQAGDAMALTTGERTSVGTAVWSSTTRTLTSFGTLVADIATAVWGAATRTLSAFGFTVDTNANPTETAIKTTTDKLTFTVPNQVDANTKSINDTTITGDGQPGSEFGV